MVLEDDPNTAKFLKSVLTSVGYTCDIALTCRDAAALMKSSKGDYQYDLMILDRVVSDGDSLDMLINLRCIDIKTPAIYISALSSHDNKIKAFDFGADDFIAKSELHKGEFLARIRAVLRRCFGHHFSKFKIGNMVVDFHMQVCKMNGKVVPLTNKEYSMLELLCLHGRGAIISKDKFISHLYSNNEPTEQKIIDVFACKLRSKLAAYNNGVSYLQTIWGRGYTLNENAGFIKDSKEKMHEDTAADAS
jgi:DNA-binding response OmpR family regulator